MSYQEFDADVAIVGAGPVGTMLAVLLGQRGHRAIVVEKGQSFTSGQGVSLLTMKLPEFWAT